MLARQATQAAEENRGSLRDDPGFLVTRAGFAPDPWQWRLLQGGSQATLLNCSRQAGKSSAVALVIVQTLLRDEQMIVVIAPSLRQTKEIMRKVLAYWRKLGRPVGAAHVTRTTLELENGSRLEALPGKPDTIVGFSAVNLLVIDEAARVPDELYNAVAPMLAVSGGRLMAPSTPKGKRGWWYQLWCDQQDPEIARVMVRAQDVPRIPPAFLARERRRIGDWWYRQEYNCEFLEAQGAAFREIDIEAAFRADVPFDRELFA